MSTFSPEERAAMKALAAERKALRNADESEAALKAAIDALESPDRELTRKIDAIVREVAPDLIGRTWYGMPAWARGANTLIFFQSGIKFKTRYCTLGFTEHAHMDDGEMWPTSFAVADITDEVVERVRGLVRRAVA